MLLSASLETPWRSRPLFGEGESDPQRGEEQDEVTGWSEEGTEGFDHSVFFRAERRRTSDSRSRNVVEAQLPCTFVLRLRSASTRSAQDEWGLL